MRRTHKLRICVAIVSSALLGVCFFSRLGTNWELTAHARRIGNRNSWTAQEVGWKENGEGYAVRVRSLGNYDVYSAFSSDGTFRDASSIRLIASVTFKGIPAIRYNRGCTSLAVFDPIAGDLVLIQSLTNGRIHSTWKAGENKVLDVRWYQDQDQVGILSGTTHGNVFLSINPATGILNHRIDLGNNSLTGLVYCSSNEVILSSESPDNDSIKVCRVRDHDGKAISTTSSIQTPPGCFSWKILADPWHKRLVHLSFGSSAPNLWSRLRDRLTGTNSSSWNEVSTSDWNAASFDFVGREPGDGPRSFLEGVALCERGDVITFYYRDILYGVTLPAGQPSR